MAGLETAPSIPEPLLRLGGTGKPEDFLAPHHLEASSRLARLFDGAALRQRVTMSYDPGRVGRSRGAAQADISDNAADARKRLAVFAGLLPPDCWGVLVDVCLYDKGLQQVETERNWPRRSAKLVLRIGLDQVAARMGLLEQATGRDRATTRSWLPERVPMG
ncbi:DUF6456 domain-containing protein [Devosia sp. CAU 1758]